MWESHGVRVDEASEAIADVDALLFDPDTKTEVPAGIRHQPANTGRHNTIFSPERATPQGANRD